MLKSYLRNASTRRQAADALSPIKVKRAVRSGADLPPAYREQHQQRIAALAMHHAIELERRGEANPAQRRLLEGRDVA